MLRQLLLNTDRITIGCWRPAGTLQLELDQAGFLVETARPADYDGDTPAAQLTRFRQTASIAFDKTRLTLLKTGPQIDYTSVRLGRSESRRDFRNCSTAETLGEFRYDSK